MDRLKEFVLTETLSCDAATKSAVFLGTIQSEPCILKLSRLALPSLSPGLLPVSTLHHLETNLIYSWGTGSLSEASGSCYFDVVYPATPQHIAKYREFPLRVVTETPEQYKQVVKPYINEQRTNRLDWVRAILHDGAEADRVTFRDEQFLLLPNSKWDRETIDGLYMLVLVTNNELASIRDLRFEHIPLLQHIRDTSCRVIAAKYGVPAAQLKLYFHYQPSYYHLHVHVANVALRQNDFGKSVMLNDVIDRLAHAPMDSATLTYFLAENHEVYRRLQLESAE